MAKKYDLEFLDCIQRLACENAYPNLFSFRRNLRKKADRAKKTRIFCHFQKRGENDGFLALAALFSDFVKIKKMEQ